MIGLARLVPIAAALLSTCPTNGLTFAAPPPPSHPQKTVVVTGATGRVGSRLLRHLLRRTNGGVGGDQRHTAVVALVRNATRARSMFGAEEVDGALTILEADFADPSSLEEAARSARSSGGGSSCGIRLFLACGNAPDQAALEMNAARAFAGTVSTGGNDCFCVKLSTAQPLVENSIGVGAVHRAIEESLQRTYPDRCAILRPNIFSQMFDPSEGAALLAIDLGDGATNDVCRHMYADSSISVIDADDVAACAAAILSSDDPAADHGGKIYELTGPEAVGLSGGFARALSSIRPAPVSFRSRSVREHIVAVGMPPATVEVIAPFLEAIGSYGTVTGTVEELTGRPPRPLSDLVRDRPRAFLPG